MSFFEKIKSSIYDPSFYRKIPKESLRTVLKYYFLLCLLITGLHVVFLVFPIARGITTATETITDIVFNRYPQNLKVNIRNGKLSTNQPEPYRIPVCFEDNRCDIIVIDTKKPDISAYLKQQDVFLLVTEDTAFIKQSDGDARVQSLAKIDNLTINKQILIKFVQTFSPWIPFVTPVIILFTGIGIYLGYLLKLLTIFFLALLIWLIAKRLPTKLTYKQAYKVGLHAITLSFIVTLLLDATHWFLGISSFIFMQTIIALIVFVINFNTAGTKVEKGKKSL